MITRIDFKTMALAVALSLGVAACSSPEQQAQAHYEFGVELLKKNDYTRAALEFRNAVRLNDKQVDAWYALATIGEETKDLPLVSSSLQKTVELDPNHFEARRKLAGLQLIAGDLEAALRNINAAAELKPDDSSVLATRAAIHLRMGDREAARQDAEKSLASNPDNPDALAVLAADALSSGNTSAALIFVDRGLSTDPDNLGLLIFKLKIVEDRKDLPKFEETLRKIVALQPENTDIRRGLVKFLVGQKRDQEAEAELRAMAAAKPDDFTRALEVVSFLNSRRGADAAQGELDRLVRDYPKVAAYRLARAEFDLARGQSDAAIATVKEVIAEGGEPQDVTRATLLLATMELSLGRKDSALGVVEGILKTDPKNADALAIRASLRLEGNDADGAVLDLREALNQKPESPALNALLAKAHAQQGSVDLAIQRYVDAVKTSRFDPKLSLEAVQYLSQRGRKELASSIITDASVVHPDNKDILLALAQLKLEEKDWAGVQKIADTLKKMATAQAFPKTSKPWSCSTRERSTRDLRLSRRQARTARTHPNPPATSSSPTSGPDASRTRKKFCRHASMPTPRMATRSCSLDNCGCCRTDRRRPRLSFVGSSPTRRWVRRPTSPSPVSLQPQPTPRNRRKSSRRA